ncbi:hypothetical protein PEPTYR26121_01499 [Peptoniphilus tyrrelliae]|nr:hypothetical protein PEPTYR26121_01499 [Peptoniphilus tyrrelliae]
MEKKDIRKLYLEQVEDYCNVIFDEIPAGVELALDELVEFDPMQYSLTSEKLSDMSMTYSDNCGDIPKYIRAWLEPYRRIHLVGDKRKRFYSGCKRYKQGGRNFKED